jgi:hypothetical protein
MKKNDLIVITASIAVIMVFVLNSTIIEYYTSFNHEHSYIMAFIKFAILATFGEALGKRISVKQYLPTGFGVIPRAVIWGLLGITIKVAFVIFSTGVPSLLDGLGVNISAFYEKGIAVNKIIVALAISTMMNLIYAPIMMTLHKITDTHILSNNGKVNALIKPIDFTGILLKLDWDKQWNFVFKKTIPFFWIPAHTITFLLPSDYRIIFAALLGIALGVILSVANIKK